ncbi:hypothetical protein JCM1393_18100 [Clostridium carnis]
MVVDFNKKSRLNKNLFMGILILLIGQQIYFPMSYKYFHLALCFVFILITDIYDIKFRNYKRETTFIIVTCLLGAIPVVDTYMNFNFKAIYYIVLLFGCYLTLDLVWNTYKLFKEKNAEEKFSSKNKDIYNKNSRFIEVYMGAMATIIFLAIGYVIFDLFKSII